MRIGGTNRHALPYLVPGIHEGVAQLHWRALSPRRLSLTVAGRTSALHGHLPTPQNLRIRIIKGVPWAGETVVARENATVA